MHTDRTAHAHAGVHGSQPSAGVSRRSSLQVGGAAGGGLLLSLFLPAARGAADEAPPSSFAPSRSKSGEIRVHRVVCAADCGTVVNSNTVQAQVQGAVIFGITAALYGNITLKDGRVEQGNFDTYQALRMNEAPTIDVRIVHSNEPPGGMGEPGTSAIVPAVINAIFAATGQRLRTLPVDPARLKQA